jgi:SAM-dependent methyltransferase
MTDYWKDHYNANAEKFPESPLKQVDRTINGSEMCQAQLELSINAVIEVLGLRSADRVIDLCCGNGMITKAIAQKTEKVIAVDFSEKLVDYARRFNHSPNIDYIVSDVLYLPRIFFESSNKFYMRDSISCLNASGFSCLLRSIASSSEFESLYISGVPDAEKLSIYYDDDEKMAFYRHREAVGRPHIGNWWTREEIKKLVEVEGLKVSFLAQNRALASAYYRFDFVVEKNHPYDHELRPE